MKLHEKFRGKKILRTQKEIVRILLKNLIGETSLFPGQLALCRVEGAAQPQPRASRSSCRTPLLCLESIPARLCSGLGPDFSLVALLAIPSRRGMEPLARVTFLLSELAQRSFFLFFFLFFLFYFAPSVRAALHRSQYFLFEMCFLSSLLSLRTQ